MHSTSTCPPEWTAPVYTKHTADIVDRPLVAELQLSPERETDVRLRFKMADEAPKILIVTDKLLTGYDAPILYCMYLDKPMRNHVLLQAMARVNRPYVDLEGGRKRIGLVVDFVGVLRELKKALQFQSSDVSGAIEDLDLLVRDFWDKISVARAAYLDHDHVSSATEAREGRAPASTGEDLRLEQILYKRLLPREAREEFFTAYKDIEALWEILSPSVALRDHIDTYKLLAKLYTVVRHAYSDHANPMVDLARKTRRLVEGSATMEGPAFLKTTVTFDVRTVEALQNETGVCRGQGIQPRSRVSTGSRGRSGDGTNPVAVERSSGDHTEELGRTDGHRACRHGSSIHPRQRERGSCQ